MVKIKTGNRTNNGCQNHTENYTLKKKKKPKQNKRGSGIIRVYPDFLRVLRFPAPIKLTATIYM
jgi:hypothetical protein